MRGSWFGAVGCAALVVTTVVLIGAARGRSPEVVLDPRSAEAKAATHIRVDAQRDISAGRRTLAEDKLTELMATYSKSGDADTQDQVAAAGMTLGYLAADKGDYEKARSRFERVDAAYAGTGAASAEYGRLDDQAAYQAIVCLQAEGKRSEAVKGYLDFLESRPHSPLIYAVHKRLNSLDPERAEDNDRAMQAALDARDKHLRRELAMCGPRSVARLLRELGIEPASQDELRELCGTTDDGTTMAGMARAFEALGFVPKGRQLNYTDFREEKAPFIWLMRTHYVVVLGWRRDRLRYYDPMYNSERETALTKDQEAAFTATVLTVSPRLKGGK